MELITIDEFKGHARIDSDDEDAAIQVKIDAVNAYVSSFLPTESESGATVPDDVKQAALQIASEWWENREDSFPGQIGEIPLDAMEILLNHREFAFG